MRNRKRRSLCVALLIGEQRTWLPAGLGSRDPEWIFQRFSVRWVRACRNQFPEFQGFAFICATPEPKFLRGFFVLKQFGCEWVGDRGPIQNSILLSERSGK